MSGSAIRLLLHWPLFVQWMKSRGLQHCRSWQSRKTRVFVTKPEPRRRGLQDLRKDGIDDLLSRWHWPSLLLGDCERRFCEDVKSGARVDLVCPVARGLQDTAHPNVQPACWSCKGLAWLYGTASSDSQGRDGVSPVLCWLSLLLEDYKLQ
jgi:hypothetical protein